MTRLKSQKASQEQAAPKLPQGWAIARLDEVASLVNGFAFSPRQWRTSGLPIIRIQNLNRPDAAFNYFDGELAERFRVRNGELLFAWSGTPGTSFGAHVWRGGDAWLNQHIFRVEFDRQLIDVDYLCAAINYNLGDYVAQARGGSGLAHVSIGVLRSSWIRIAPLEEQRRVVAAVGAIEREIDAGKLALSTARESLRQFLSSVLRVSVGGELTTDWRRQHTSLESATDLLMRMGAPLVKSQAAIGRRLRLPLSAAGAAASSEWTSVPAGVLPRLPASWLWTTVERVGEVRVGRQRSPRRVPGATMHPYLRVANVFEDCIDISDVLRMPFTRRETEVYRLKNGDVLLNEGQSLELVGRAAIYRDEIPGACFQNTLIRFRSASCVLPDFALLVFRHYLHSRRFQRSAKWTTNIAHLSASRFVCIEFPLPPLEEQREIVANAAIKLAGIAESERAIEGGLARSRELHDTALREAFKGRLADQDPADESGELLLDRIRESTSRRIAMKGSAKRSSTQGVAMAKKAHGQSLLAILKRHPKGMSPEELFRASEFELANIDAFYGELRDIMSEIEEQRPAKKNERRWPKAASFILRVRGA